MADREGYQFPLAWIGIEETPIQVSNHFLSQFDEQLFYLSFGIATPPVLFGIGRGKASSG
jgi:hypothetical protein